MPEALKVCRKMLGNYTDPIRVVLLHAILIIESFFLA